MVAGSRSKCRPSGRGHAAAPFYLSATAFLIVAGALELGRLAGAPGLEAWRWPIVHLIFVGGVTQLIIGSMSFFAVTLLMTMPAPTWMSRAQWGLINFGAIGLAAGTRLGVLPLAGAGAAAVLGSLVLTLAVFRVLERRSLREPDVTLRYYKTAIVFLLVGATFGTLMLLGLSGSVGPYDRVRLSHLHLNLLGWVTLTIIGTMRLFFGSVLGAPARYLNPLWREYWPFVVGTAIQVSGWMTGSGALIGTGSMLQAVAILAYGTSIVRQWRAHDGARTLAAWHLLAATVWLVIETLGGAILGVLPAFGVEVGSGWTTAVATIGFIGFTGQTVLGAWTHLFSVVAALPGRPIPPQDTPFRPRLRAVLNEGRWLQLGLVNLSVASLALSQGIGSSSVAGQALFAGGLAGCAVVLAIVVVKVARVLALVWSVRRVTALEGSDFSAA